MSSSIVRACLLAALSTVGAELRSAAAQVGNDSDRWRVHREEQAIQRLWLDVSQGVERQPVLFEHANLLAMTDATIEADVSVLVRDGRIAWIGSAGEENATDAEGALRVDATGRYLMPGLTDMHVHRTVTQSMALLSLANGVTTERVMCGYPWILAQREAIRAGRLLAPQLFVSGHILNARPMGMFATVVETPEAARRVVREHAAAGYDFIKVHNNMALDVYRAVFAAADALDIRVVGHVPQDVTVEEAIAIGHQTLEHFKGYILDRGLELTSEDYVALTDGSGAWNCPTLSTRVIGLVGDEAIDFLDGFEGMRYVSVYDLERWYAQVETRDPRNSHARVWELSRGIFTDLLATDARFLAGSDSGGGYENQVPGFMLHEELRLMEELGLSTFETLQAATVNAAEALETRDFGTVEAGKRADLILLAKNPLDGVANARRPLGVMVGGVWLDRAWIDRVLDGIEEIYSHGGAPERLRAPSDDELDAFVDAMVALHAEGMVAADHHVAEIGDLLRARGRADDAARVDALRVR